MSNTKLVIKGAFYYDRDNDVILMPHFTGEFHTVDCSSYEQMEELKSRYSESYIENAKETKIEFEGKEYYSTEYGPYYINDWELLSDLSELVHTEESFDF